MIECEIGTLPSNCCMPASKMPCPCNTCSKVAQIAAIRGRINDLFTAFPYMLNLDSRDAKAIKRTIISDVFDFPTKHMPSELSLLPDDLAAWLWEMGVRG